MSKNIALVFAFALFVQGPAFAADPPGNPNTFRIAGSTNIRLDWNCTGSARATATPDQTAKPVPGFPGGVKTASVDILIQGIDSCSGGGIMISHLQKSLKSEQFPLITYALSSYEPNSDGTFTANGTLTIAGESRELRTTVTLNPLADGKVAVTGVFNVDMTQWGVAPPKKAFARSLPNVDVAFNVIIP